MSKKAHQKTNGPKQKKTTKQSVREGTGGSKEVIWSCPFFTPLYAIEISKNKNNF